MNPTLLDQQPTSTKSANLKTESYSIQGSLNALQIAEYYQQGYIVLRKLIDPKTVQLALNTIDERINHFKKHPGYVVWETEGVKNKKPEDMTSEERILSARRVHWSDKRDENFMRLGAYKPLVNVLTSILGENIKILQDMALIKPPRIGSEKPLHQDAAYFEVEPHDQTVGTWWALDPATIENGCMVVWPNTHRMPVVNHKAIQNTPHLVIDQSSADCAKQVPLPMEPGDVLVFSSHIFHYTPANHSDFRRRSLQIHYMSAHCRLGEGRKARPYDLVSGESQPGCI
jgi:phytanoyl-CoA hydroxylase